MSSHLHDPNAPSPWGSDSYGINGSRISLVQPRPRRIIETGQIYPEEKLVRCLPFGEFPERSLIRRATLLLLGMSVLIALFIVYVLVFL